MRKPQEKDEGGKRKDDKKGSGSASSSFILHPSSFRAAAFTLVEMLVVISILAILSSLVVVGVFSSFRKASTMRSQADLQTISTALEAYKQDFGDYPRIPVDPATGLPVANTGAAILGKALLGSYGDGKLPLPSTSVDPNDPVPYNGTVPYKAGDCVGDGTDAHVVIVDIPGGNIGTGNYSFWARFDPRDGADGPGFRTRGGPGSDGIYGNGDDVAPQGKVYGPYIAPGKIKSQGVYLIDQAGGPILYFPARPGNVSVSSYSGAGQTPYVDMPPSNETSKSLYNAKNNFEIFRRTGETDDAQVLRRIRVMMNDFNTNGVIDVGEEAVNKPYLLWSSGRDGVFGPADYAPAAAPTEANISANRKAVAKADDVMNFR